MIGNDVVDLELAQQESNWKRKGFLDKIFTKKEHKYILNFENPTIAVWNLWSRKEAAYKIWNRETKIRSYNPIRFECLDFDKEFGKVKFGSTIFYTKTEITPNFIYSIAVVSKKHFGFIKIIDNSICVEKINGFPFFFNENKDVLVASKSNHGRFEKTIALQT